MSYAQVPDQRLEIDDVPLTCAAWTTLNLDEMWQFSLQRGADFQVPGAHGARPLKRFRAATVRTLELAVYGNVDWEGNDTDGPWEGLEANLRHIYDNVAAPTGTGDGTRDAVLYLPDESTRSGSVHVVRFEWAGQSGASFARATLDISIPAGHLEYDGS